ncbi:MAG: hypothetical protein ABI315_05000 [Bacteroidia bacterium]
MGKRVVFFYGITMNNIVEKISFASPGIACEKRLDQIRIYAYLVSVF